MYYLSTKAHEGPQQPTKAYRPTKMEKSQTMERYVFFLLYILFFIFYITSRLHHTHHTPLWRGRQPRKPTKAPAANEGPRRPTKMENSTSDGEVRVFLPVHFIFYFLYYQPAAPHPPHPSLAWTTATKAHEGPRRPTKREKGPNDARRVVWAIGKFFYLMYFF